MFIVPLAKPRTWPPIQEVIHVETNHSDLRGNSGTYDDVNYERGALHEGAAIHFAALRGYDADVLDLPGKSAKQISEAVKRFTEKDSTYHALFGFSGGGYHVGHILDLLPPEALQRVNLVVVLGAPPTRPVLNSAGKTKYVDCEVDGEL